MAGRLVVEAEEQVLQQGQVVRLVVELEEPALKLGQVQLQVLVVRRAVELEAPVPQLARVLPRGLVVPRMVVPLELQQVLLPELAGQPVSEAEIPVRELFEERHWKAQMQAPPEAQVPVVELRLDQKREQEVHRRHIRRPQTHRPEEQGRQLRVYRSRRHRCRPDVCLAHIGYILDGLVCTGNPFHRR